MLLISVFPQFLLIYKASEISAYVAHRPLVPRKVADVLDIH